MSGHAGSLTLRAMLGQFMRYAAVGAVGTLAHYATLVSLVSVLGLNVVLATTAGFVVGAIVNYALNYHFTFRSASKHSQAFVKFFGVALVGMLLNAAIMAALHGRLPLHYMVLQVFTTGLILVWTFVANRLWTFASDRRPTL
jgi:putative flippase GtrA